jgi:hypothetical protein
MIYGLYNTIFIIAVLMAVVFLGASVMLFFVWKIPQAIRELRVLSSGRK